MGSKGGDTQQVTETTQIDQSMGITAADAAQVASGAGSTVSNLTAGDNGMAIDFGSGSGAQVNMVDPGAFEFGRVLAEEAGSTFRSGLEIQSDALTKLANSSQEGVLAASKVAQSGISAGQAGLREAAALASGQETGNRTKILIAVGVGVAVIAAIALLAKKGE